MNIEVVPSAGYCRGVARAVKMAEQAAPCYTLGPLIHNRRAVGELEGRGVKVIQSLDELPDGASLVLRCHGAPPGIYAEAERRGISVTDATCPDVKRIHGLVSVAGEEGRTVLLFGDPGHPEVTATAAWCRRCIVFSSLEELQRLLDGGGIDPSEPLALASQTTSKRDVFTICCEFLKKECTNIKILDTICGTTDLRQRGTAALSRRADVMVVVGDPASANTRHLAEVCLCPVFFTEGGSGARSLLKDNPGIVASGILLGVTAGASTPSAIIKEVVSAMTEEIKNETVNETVGETEGNGGSGEPRGSEQTFEEMLEPTLRPLHTGDKVTGVVTGVSPTEVSVDLGSKHAAYIPLAELTDDPSADISGMVRVGDEIETYVMRVNDVEGVVMLSKRRLDTVKSWEEVEAAQDTRVVMEGTVVEENKGGVVVSVRGVRVFVPASQTGLPKDAPMSDLLKSKVRLRITEFQRSRRRVVGSIRAVTQEERRARSEEFWNGVGPGKEYNGVVKSLTSYGAFVDIGGVDGLVHLSELSWQRLKAPSDMLKVGDPLAVTVISVDKEKRRISLRHKNPADDPWLKFTDVFHAGDILNVTVNKLMPFGAFAEVMPGVDGLIHVSQITDHHIQRPADAVAEGDKLDVKITDIDYARKKISLSARALIEREPEPVTEDDGRPDEIVAISDETQTLVAGDLVEDEAGEGAETAKEVSVTETAGTEAAAADEETKDAGAAETAAETDKAAEGSETIEKAPETVEKEEE